MEFPDAYLVRQLLHGMFIFLVFGSLSSKKSGLVNTVVAELQVSNESS